MVVGIQGKCPPEGMGPARIYRPRGHIINTNDCWYWTESQLHLTASANPSWNHGLRAADRIQSPYPLKQYLELIAKDTK